MSQPRVPSCGRHLGKFDDVTIYPVLVVARCLVFLCGPNLGSENPGPLPVAVLAASLVCEKWQSLACMRYPSEPVACSLISRKQSSV